MYKKLKTESVACLAVRFLCEPLSNIVNKNHERRLQDLQETFVTLRSTRPPTAKRINGVGESEVHSTSDMSHNMYSTNNN